MRRIRNGGRAQAGDTIIEVLIAILVISVVLVGAYAAVSKNTVATQTTLEHSQALQYVQAQIEYLRAANGVLASGYTCFSPTTGAPATSSGCAIMPTAGGASYTLSVTKPLAGATYTISAAWTSIGGSINGSNVTIYYKPV